MDLQLCTSCLEMRHPQQFIDGDTRCSLCRGVAEPSVRAIGTQARGEEDHVSYHRQTRACSKCGRVGYPGPIARHERKCAGIAPQTAGGRQRAADTDTPTTAVAVRRPRAVRPRRLEVTIPDAVPAEPTVAAIRAVIAQRREDLDRAVALIDEAIDTLADRAA